MKEVYGKEKIILARLEEQEKMPKEEILRYAKKIRPLVRGNKGEYLDIEHRNDPLYWANAQNIATKSFTYSQDNAIKVAEGLKEVGRINTYHRYGGFYGILRPSVDEAIVQCPKEWLDKVTAFEVQADSLSFSEVYSTKLDRHVLRTIYYTGLIPEDIVNLPVEW